MHNESNFVVGVDIGGTFTDAYASDGKDIAVSSKSPTTPEDLSRGVLKALEELAGELKMPLDQLLSQTSFVSHGTTVALNAIVIGQTCKVGFITTKGHRDSIYIMNLEGRYAGLSPDQIQNIFRTIKPAPLLSKQMVREVSERMDYKGEVVVPLNEDEVRQAVKYLLAEKVVAIAVSFLWSFLNPAHEKRVKEIIYEISPDLYVTLSHEICPRIREYPRSVTTIMSSQIGPILNNYLIPLKSELKKNGLKGPLLIMQGNGGTISSEEAYKYPINSIGSVLSGGVVGTLALGEKLGHKNIITTDVGGTTFLVGLVVDGAPVFSSAYVINQYRVNVPMVRVEAIGSGGGAIAWLDGQKNLHVGPRSAQAVPGPACYGEGGTEPTVTDADLVLGILNPDYFLGGRKKLNVELAKAVLKEKIGDPLHLSPEEAAMAVYTIQNAQTADLVRKTVVEGGYDPRDFVMYAFGGAGPVHGCSYGKDVGAKEIVIPLGPAASAFSAFGLASSDVILTIEMSDPSNFPIPADRVNANFTRLEEDARSKIDAQGISFSDIRFRREIDVRFTAQIYEVSTPVKNGQLVEEDLKQIIKDFEEKYERQHGQGTGFSGAGYQFITYRVFITGALPNKPSLNKLPLADQPLSKALKERRNVFLDPTLGWQKTPIYDYNKLACGHDIKGPAIVECPGTSVVISADVRQASVDQFGNIVIKFS
jgi:N-methylhydantoinase A